jgi:hypothetical protein
MACRAKYPQGHEIEYVTCMLCYADSEADERARLRAGRDQYIVRRATKALVQLQGQSPHGVLGADILDKAGFQVYANSSSHGLWPWLAKSGGRPVVVKFGATYRIDESFYPALQQALNVPSSTSSVCAQAPCP